MGAQTMSPAMREMRAYPRYLFEQLSGVLGRRVLEIGVGFGTYTVWIRELGSEVLATDVDEQRLREIGERFAGDPLLRTGRLDLTDEESVLAQRSFEADSVICLNVLEHIEDDVSAMRWVRESVVPGAGLGLIVPAHPKLFGRMDVEAGHFRRYTRRSLRDVLCRAGWSVERIRYLNVAGAAGWWYHNRWRKDAGLADDAVNAQMGTADRWLPRLARLTDPFFQQLAGLSVLAIGRA